MKIRKGVACCRLRVGRLTVKAPDSEVDRHVSLLCSRAPVVERAHMDSCFHGNDRNHGNPYGTEPPHAEARTPNTASQWHSFIVLEMKDKAHSQSFCGETGELTR